MDNDKLYELEIILDNGVIMSKTELTEEEKNAIVDDCYYLMEHGTVGIIGEGATETIINGYKIAAVNVLEKGEEDDG